MLTPTSGSATDLMLTRLARHPALLYIGSTYLSRGPACVDIELTNRCNLRCEMCWFHGEAGVGDRYRDSEMTTGQVRQVIDQVAKYRPYLYFGGAEPLMRADFVAILSHAKERGLPVGFTTNGTLLESEVSDGLVTLGVDDISVSIDGARGIHDALRGPGTFEKVMGNLRCLLETRRTKGAVRPSVSINLTMNPLLVGGVEEAIRTIRDETYDLIDSITIHHLWFVTASELQAHQEAVRKALGRSAAGAAAHRLSRPLSFDAGALAGELSCLEGTHRVRSFPDLRGEEVRDFYAEDYRSGRRCIAPFRAVVVKPNGDVTFCPDEWIDDYVLGNVCHEAFDSIWSGAKARHFRRVVWRRRSFSACQRCSWMHMGW